MHQIGRFGAAPAASSIAPIEGTEKVERARQVRRTAGCVQCRAGNPYQIRALDLRKEDRVDRRGRH